MRIHLVTETFPPEVNGVAMTLHHLVTGLQQRGHQLTVIRPRQKANSLAPDSTWSEILVTGLPLPGYSGLQFGLPSKHKLLRAWRQTPPDLVHIATEGPLGHSALSAARSLGIPAISSYHTNFHSYGEHYGYGILKKPLMAYFRRFHNRTRATFVPSEDVRESLTRHHFANIHILARGVDTSLYSPERRREDLRASWGASPTTPVVLYVGRVAPEKNIELTCEAFERLRQHHPEARLVIVGDGPARKKLAARHSHIHFAGMQHGQALAEHYASGDLFFFASTTETFGNVITEAMASGLLVLAYDYAAARRHLRHTHNGYSAPYRDKEAYLQAASALATNPQTWPALRAAARQTALDLSWDSVLNTFDQDITRITASHR